MIDYSCLCSWTKEKITCCCGTVTICWNNAPTFHLYTSSHVPPCTVCQVQPCLVASAHKTQKSHLNWMQLQFTLGILMGYWVCGYLWVFFSSLILMLWAGTFCWLLLLMFPLKHKGMHQTTSIITSFVSSFPVKKPFCICLPRRFFHTVLSWNSLHVFKSLTLTTGISQSIFIQKSSGM